ncbi:MAG TPA: bifunctional DNA-formamidopyrimidine glycosylase/DNA-(apurinic or apyrimidinic site) lyase [Caulobacteraceae bacterium]|jgi:formamidopyrimidine-DNA glycosylase|nr:bifunctional DNA-formamidopyrimidine glycosylase/DNA-(apurinic or apyrimidinic site) lyase [Caulobacteraceae bacterium]
MPELPEVETVRQGLRPSLEGARLKRVIQRRPDLRFPLPDRFAERLTGARVVNLGRRAKYLMAELDTGETWTTHLGMTGRFTVGAKTPGRFAMTAPDDDKHEHLVFETDKNVVIGFADARRFGYMNLIPTAEIDEHPWFKGLGPEPLGNGFNAEHLAEAFAGRKQNVKATLLDQRVVAGLGNIYVCEALYRSHISPKKPAGKLKPDALEALSVTVRKVIAEAIEAGGSTLRDFAGADGELGYFQHRFKAYGREGEKCLTRGCGGTIKRIVQAGRSTFYCPKCQR